MSSNAKGNAFERDCARDLTEYITRYREDEPRRDPPVMWRSQASGGWPYRRVEDVLDLAPKAELGADFLARFGVECKHQGGTVLWSPFTQEEPKVARWWNKAWSECAEHDLCPMLMVRKTRMPLLVGLPSTLIPVTEVMFENSWVWEALCLRFVAWEEFYDLPLERLYEFRDRWTTEPPDDRSGRNGS